MSQFSQGGSANLWDLFRISVWEKLHSHQLETKKGKTEKEKKTEKYSWKYEAPSIKKTAESKRLPLKKGR